METLEPRVLFALSLSLQDGMLSIGGTAGADTIVVSRIESGLMVQVNKAMFGLPAEEVQRISIKGLGGHDRISFGDGVNVPVTIFGGQGNDSLSGGARSN